MFQNKTPTCQYRAVGHPIATAVTEGLVDSAARGAGLDPAEFRRRNLMRDGTYPRTSPAGMRFEGLSHEASLDKLLGDDGLPGLRAEQERLRAQGIYRGIGLASFIELTNPSPFIYGVGGARISAQDGCTVRIDPDGSVMAATGVTEQGQGTEAIMRQIVADAVGVPIDEVRVHHRRHADHALRRRHLGVRAAPASAARRRCRRASPSRKRPEGRRRHAAGAARRARPRRRRDRRASDRRSRACRSPSSPASSISAATRCRPTCRAS